MYYYFLITAFAIFCLGLLGVLTCPRVLNKLINFIVAFNAINLLLISADYFMIDGAGKIFVFLIISFLSVFTVTFLSFIVFVRHSSDDLDSGILQE
jgi:NADH:ubiquinone oxidoreductase subunit K